MAPPSSSLLVSLAVACALLIAFTSCSTGGGQHALRFLGAARGGGGGGGGGKAETLDGLWSTKEAALLKEKEERALHGGASKHPLDPLSVVEMTTAREILIEAGLLIDGQSQVHGVELHEPPKAVVLEWEKGNAFPAREAFVIIWREKKINQIAVDITNKKVLKEEVYTGTGMPILTNADFEIATAVPTNYLPFVEAVKKRNIPIEDVICVPLSGGWFNRSEEAGLRIVRATCYSKKHLNYHMLPVEGITLYVDLDAKEVYHFLDQGPLPGGSPSSTEYTLAAMAGPLDAPFRPISIEQPGGVNFDIKGYIVSWAKWKFHARPDPRAGLIISRVTFNDTVTDTVRDVMYQGHLSEMFVPYQDPSPNWFFRTYMDVGEYGFGLLSMGLIPLNDCPRNARYMDAVLADPEGRPYVLPNMMCVFEKYAGDAVWRHTDPFLQEGREVRPKVTLVVRQAATVGNYDYTVDWEFQTDGLIKVSVIMSGMVTVKNIKAPTMDDLEIGESLHGTMVNDHTVAVIHDHFINFRLDMDVDGPHNSFEKAKLVTVDVPEGTSWRKSVWDVEKSVPQTELEGQYNVSSLSPAEYFIVNKGSKTRLGNHRSYKLVPRTSGVPLLRGDDYPQIRAAWCKNSIWVTPYDPEERWAGGMYPNQQHGEDTLATWTLKERPIVDTDIVVWYSVVYHHVPVQEDFPVMPSTVGGFDIKPANFFELNPAIRAHPFVSENMPSCGNSGVAA